MDFTTGELLEEEDFLGVTIPEAQGVDLHAVHGSPDGVLTAIGGNYVMQAGPFEGAVVSRRLGSAE